MQRIMAFTLIVSAFALQACGNTANATISPSSSDVWSRSDAIDHIANTACQRADACKQIGAKDGDFDTMDDCLIQQRAKFSDKWSAAACSDPHGVIEGQLATCEANVARYSCTSNILDLAGALSECGESDLCR